MLIVVRGILCKFVVVSGHQDSASATRKGVVVSTLGEPNCRKLFVWILLFSLLFLLPCPSLTRKGADHMNERTVTIDGMVRATLVSFTTFN